MDNNTPETPQTPTPIAPNTTPTTPTQPSAPAPASGLVIASLIVGVVALSVSWIPVLGVIITIGAIIFSLITLRKTGSGKMVMVGLVAGILGFICSLAMSAFIISSLMSSPSNDTKNGTQSSEEAKGSDSGSSVTRTGDGYEISANSASFDNMPSDTDEDSSSYIIVNVTVKNVSDKEKNFEPGFFGLNVDGSFSGVSRAMEAPPVLTRTTLAPGESVNGNLAFEQPTDETKPLALEYILATRNEDGTTKSLLFNL